MKQINLKTIDELNNMSLNKLKLLEDEVFRYYKKVKAVRRFTEEIEVE